MNRSNTNSPASPDHIVAQPVFHAMKNSTSLHQASKNVNVMQCFTRDGLTQVIADIAIIEEPLLVSLSFIDAKTQQQKTSDLTVMMRTPGDDLALIQGLLFSEQIITNITDIIAITPFDEPVESEVEDDVGSKQMNHFEVKLAPYIIFDQQKHARNFASQSSCGLCGKSSIQALALATNATLDTSTCWLSCDDIINYAQALTTKQPLFAQTGGVHGAGYIANKQWHYVFEDVGRHNAVDKVIGSLLANNSFAEQSILVLSGRVSFELIQKAIVAGIAVIIAIGAPSSLAISTAIQFNITLIGFTKAQQFNVYSGQERIALNARC